jgi:hypothetical protein
MKLHNGLTIVRTTEIKKKKFTEHWQSHQDSSIKEVGTEWICITCPTMWSNVAASPAGIWSELWASRGVELWAPPPLLLRGTAGLVRAAAEEGGTVSWAAVVGRRGAVAETGVVVVLLPRTCWEEGAVDGRASDEEPIIGDFMAELGLYRHTPGVGWESGIGAKTNKTQNKN